MLTCPFVCGHDVNNSTRAPCRSYLGARSAAPIKTSIESEIRNRSELACLRLFKKVSELSVGVRGLCHENFGLHKLLTMSRISSCDVFLPHAFSLLLSNAPLGNCVRRNPTRRSPVEVEVTCATRTPDDFRSDGIVDDMIFENEGERIISSMRGFLTSTFLSHRAFVVVCLNRSSP